MNESDWCLIRYLGVWQEIYNHSRHFSSSFCLLQAMTSTSKEPSGSGVTASQLDSLMTAMRQDIREEMVAMKSEHSQEKAASNEKLVKRLRDTVFKKKIHENQYLLNQEVCMKLWSGTTSGSGKN